MQIVTELETNRVINGSVLIIDDFMRSDQNHSFRCAEYNTVAGLRKRISDTITFTVAGEEYTAETPVWFSTKAKLDNKACSITNYSLTHLLTRSHTRSLTR